VKFALISDVHFGPRAYFGGKLRKLTHRAADLTEAFVHSMNTSIKPDLVVNLGDVIEDRDYAADLENYATFTRLLEPLSAPVLHVAGNHDTKNLTQADMRRLWGHTGDLFYSREIGGVHFSVLHTIEIQDVAVRLPDEQFAWLEADLKAATLPVVVLMHHPASEMVLTGNRWFEKAPHICRLAERRRLRALLEDSGKVLAVFNGHVHWNHFDVIASIPYVTLQSLIENIDDDAPGRPASAWAVCEISEHRLSVEVHGEDRARYQVELPARRAG
jgi:3',5'-cyclic AMP phosphodiesterase CpdA